MTLATDAATAGEVDATGEIEGPYDPEMKEAGQLTSPTWELELFLSGAFVFATFQLPGLIEAAYSRLEPHVTDTSELLLFNGVLYGKAIAFTLIAMFSIHLVMRAYWVALMGVHSVFPKGIRWSELKGGPITRAVYRERLGAMSGVIASLDNACSIVFSAGLLIVMLFLCSTCLVGLGTAIGYAVAHTVGGGSGTEAYFFGVLVLFAAVPATARILEKRAGDDIDPNSKKYRRLHRLLSLAYSLSFMGVLAPILLTLMTNIGRRRLMTVLVIALGSIITLSTVDRLANGGRLSTNTYDFFGASRNHGVDYRFYENQREPGASYARVPSVQADIVRDPYIRLFIPYSPRRDNAAIARACPALQPLQERGLQFGADSYLPDSLTEPVLRCIAQMHDVTLDGAPIEHLDFAFYEQPATGVKGVVAYIPLDSSAHGRHVLAMLPTPPADLSADTGSAQPPAWKQPLLIPFWR